MIVRAPAGTPAPLTTFPALLDLLRVYDLETARPASASFTIPQGNPPLITPVEGLLYSPDGRRLLVRQSQHGSFIAGQYQHRPAYLLDAEDLRAVGSPLKIPRTGTQSPLQTDQADFRVVERPADFSPDGRRLALADGGNVAAVFDAETGGVIGAPHVHPGRIHWVRFSPDGRRLATVGSEGSVRLWDVTTGAALGRPMVQPGAIVAEFSPDGLLLAAAGWSGRARLWDGVTAEPLVPEFELGARVTGLAFTTDPDRLVLALEARSPISRAIPVEDRPKEMLEALAIVLSGHVIDSGEGLAPASAEQLAEARAVVLRHEPGSFPARSD
jgi:WD40 repeat protein